MCFIIFRGEMGDGEVAFGGGEDQGQRKGQGGATDAARGRGAWYPGRVQIELRASRALWRRVWLKEESGGAAQARTVDLVRVKHTL